MYWWNNSKTFLSSYPNKAPWQRERVWNEAPNWNPEALASFSVFVTGCLSVRQSLNLPEFDLLSYRDSNTSFGCLFDLEYKESGIISPPPPTSQLRHLDTTVILISNSINYCLNRRTYFSLKFPWFYLVKNLFIIYLGGFFLPFWEKVGRKKWLVLGWWFSSVSAPSKGSQRRSR